MKIAIKKSVDVGMAMLFLLQMAYPLLGDTPHEWLGVALLALFIFHNVLNCKWYARLSKGGYARIFYTTVNLLLAVSCLGLTVSALLLSPTLSSLLHLRAAMLGRKLHMVCTAWSFVLASVHVGLHMPSKKHGYWITKGIVCAFCFWGLYNFLVGDIWQRMFLITDYAYFDYTEPLLACIARYLSISCLFACTAYLTKSRRI